MKAVVFDVDGTLVDSVDVHARAWQDAFEHFGHSVSFEQVRSQIGKGGDQLMPVFLSEGEVERVGEELEKYRTDLYRREYMPSVKGFPHVRELFQKLLADGWRIALASSAKGEELQTYKSISGITDLLETETSSDDAERSKPHPDIFEAAARRLELPAAECVVVGDSPYDAQAAGKAGMPAVGFLCGGFPAEDLKNAGFCVLYEGAAEVVGAYEKSWFHQRRPGAA